MSSNDKIAKKAEVLPATTAENLRHVLPKVDVYENDDELLLVADMPGVSKDTLDVRLEGNKLTLTGRQKESRQELRNGEPGAKVFQRTFTLPRSIDGEKVSAEISIGELSVHLTKSASSRSRHIQVRGA